MSCLLRASKGTERTVEIQIRFSYNESEEESIDESRAWILIKDKKIADWKGIDGLHHGHLNRTINTAQFRAIIAALLAPETVDID